MKKMRDESKPRYDLIEHDFLERLGNVLDRGAKHYGDRNWQNGESEFIVDCYNHAIEHLGKMRDGDTTEDHVMHAICNLYFISWYQSKRPHLTVGLIKNTKK